MTTAQLTARPDPRTVAFLSPHAEAIFGTVVHPGSVWAVDPFDVETIHPEARQTFADLLSRASGPTPPEHGKIFLLRGIGGSGKTHLMRSFRQYAHTHNACAGYVQMISHGEDYARYILSGLIDALDRPYLHPEVPSSTLHRIARGILDSISVATDDEKREFCEADLETAEVVKQVERLADFAIQDGRYDDRDLDVIRAFLYLLPPDRRLKSRVMKWLRCEELTSADRALLGGLTALTGDGAALRVIAGVGRTAFAALAAPLVLLTDQIEEVFDVTLDEQESGRRFRQAVDTLVNIAAHVPTAVVVVACLDTHYQAFRQKLPETKLHRLENETPPVVLKPNRDLPELEDILEQRLRCVCERAGAPFDPRTPLFPFTQNDLGPLAGLSIRKFLLEVSEHQRRCADHGEWAKPTWAGGKGGGEPPPSVWERRWNDFRNAFDTPVLDDEENLAELLAFALATTSAEMPDGIFFGAEADGHLIELAVHPNRDTVNPMYVAVCDKSTRGGGLGNQLERLRQKVKDNPTVVVRSTPFPPPSKQKASTELLKLIQPKGAGRKVEVSNSDWRAMAAFREFHAKHKAEAGFAMWQKAERPLAELPAMAAILDLNTLLAKRSVSAERPLPPSPPPVVLPPPPPLALVVRKPTTDAHVNLGQTRGAAPTPVELKPKDLCRHAAFLGGSGSGKTTTALAIIEGLLLSGVPAVLLDRKGDLARYADPVAWTTPEPDAERAKRREQLRAVLDIALFTPGTDAGRPLTIPVVPDDLAQMSSADREQTAQFAAASLGMMMGYKSKAPDPKRVILQKAIEVLARTPGRTVTVKALRELVADMDDALTLELGGYDEKHFKKLAQDLLTLAHQHRRLLEGGEPLSVDDLLGRQLPPGKTRLAVVNTQFLGDPGTVDFWVSQFLLAVDRWRAKNPADTLQAVFLFDEADLYLPATGSQPATKGPMESLLKRARSAGLGIFLATQSPGDLDYRCRDQVLTWLIGRVKEPVAIAKLRPMLDRRPEAADKLTGQKAGEFYLVREADVTPVATARNLIPTEQVPEDRILDLARCG